MSVALLIERHQAGQTSPELRSVPVSTQEPYYQNWNPVIEEEGYLWLPFLAGGLIIDADNIAEVLAELHQFLAAVPRYYAPESIPYAHLSERLTRLINELEAVDSGELARGEVELSVG